MHELMQVAKGTYYVNSPVKVGVYVEADGSTYLIDSGNDKSYGKKLAKILAENGWQLKKIINTHSHADHIGGNAYLQATFGCDVLASSDEMPFVGFPLLEPYTLYGGFPPASLKNKFLIAESSNVENVFGESLTTGFELIELKGHTLGMVGVKTPDDVLFVADSVMSENVLNKYHVSFLQDVSEYIKTLDYLETLQATLFIPSHAEPVSDIRQLVSLNREKLFDVMDVILQACSKPTCFEDVLKHVFDHYNLSMDLNQYVLVGSTVRSYLAYLFNEKIVDISFIENKLLWHKG